VRRPRTAARAAAPADRLDELDRLAGSAAADRAEVERAVLQGDPAQQIVAEALRRGVDLVVMGPHSRGAPEHWFVGSVTERVVRTAPCPVMVVKPSADLRAGRPPRRVLCAVDLGETTAATLVRAATLADTLQADLIVIHVVATPAGGPVTCGTAGADRDLIHDARASLSALVASAPIAPGCVRQKVVIGSPPDEIVDATAADGNDIVVIGSHAGSIRDRQFIGSTTVRLLRHAAAHVLVVPAAVSRPHEADRARSEAAEAAPPRTLGRAL
jgi:nucleotide-binding universal stress UspA family protein